MGDRSGRRVCVGEFGSPHGVKGLIALRAFTDVAEDIVALGPLTGDDGRSIELVLRGTRKDSLLVAVAGVSTREEAAALSRSRLYADRDALPPADADEWYHVDLIGLTALDAAGTRLGRVIAVPDFGAGPLLEIEPADGATVYVPFTETLVPRVVPDEGHVVIDPPAGLFDQPVTPDKESGA